MPTATTTLARRIDRAEAALITGMGQSVSRRLGLSQVVVAEIGTAAAVMPGPGSHLSKVAGLGFEPLDAAALDHVEREFARFETPVRVELSSLADPATGKLLSTRGYVLCGFENVLGVSLSSQDWRKSQGESEPTDIAQTTAADFEDWAAAVATGFMHADSFDGPPPVEAADISGIDLIFRDLATVDGFSQYVARRGGVVAGGASMRID